jgi:hypothetical protein
MPGKGDWPRAATEAGPTARRASRSASKAVEEQTTIEQAFFFMDA